MPTAVNELDPNWLADHMGEKDWDAGGRMLMETVHSMKIEELREVMMAQVGQVCRRRTSPNSAASSQQVQKGEKEARVRPRKKWSKPTYVW